MEYHITLIGKFMACLIHHEVHAFNYICDVTSRSYRHVGSPFKRKNSQELCKKFHKNQFIFTENIGNKGDCIHVSHHIHVYMCHKKTICQARIKKEWYLIMYTCYTSTYGSRKNVTFYKSTWHLNHIKMNQAACTTSLKSGARVQKYQNGRLPFCAVAAGCIRIEDIDWTVNLRVLAICIPRRDHPIPGCKILDLGVQGLDSAVHCSMCISHFATWFPKAR